MMPAYGDAADWMNSVGVTAAEIELGDWPVPQGWMPTSNELSLKMSTDQWSLFENSMKLIGNKISIKAIGYSKVKRTEAHT